MIISYLVFGKDKSNFRQAYFSSISFLAQLQKEDSMVILTDQPQYFNYISQHAIIHQINADTLKEWRGKHDFFWRIKIRALQHIVEQHPNQDLLYLDADTYLFGKLDDIRTKLKEGHNLMHLNEGRISQMRAKTTRHMWRKMRNKKFGGIEINSDSSMWNAGVISVPANHTEQLNLALSICDEMCLAVSRKRLLEQFAFSIALNTSSNLFPARSIIAHYWPKKPKWNKKIDEFIMDGLLQNNKLDDQVEKALHLIQSI